MVNYNSWSENKDNDSSDDSTEAPTYTGAAYQPVEKPQPRAEEQGVIFSRRVPLSELIDTQIETEAAKTLSEKHDDDTEEEEPQAYTYTVIQPTEHKNTPADAETVETLATPAPEAVEASSDDESDTDNASNAPKPPTIRATAPVPPASRAEVPAPVPVVEREPSAFEPVAMPGYAAQAPRVETSFASVPVRDYNTHPMTYEEAMAALDAQEADELTAAREPLRPFRASAPVPQPSMAPVAETLTYTPEDQATPGQAGGIVPPLPPVGRFNTAADLPPQGPASEHLIFGNNQASEYGGTMAYNVAPDARPQPVEESPRERTNRKLIGLAILGTTAEYFLRRRDVRRSESRTTKLIEEQRLANERGQEFLKRQQQQLDGEQTRQTETLQQVRANQEAMAAMPLTYAEQSPLANPQIAETAARMQTQERSVEQRPLPPIMVAPEARQNIQEKPIMPQEQSVEEEQPQLREAGDAWRHYKVDSHNREVANAVTYGEAYHQERAQEIIRDRTADDDDTTHGGSDTASNASAPIGAGSGAGSFVPSGSYASGNAGGGTAVPSLPSGMTTPTLPQGKPTHVDPQHQLAAKTKPQKEGFASNVTNPWFWLMLSLIVAAFFAAALI